MKRARFYYNNNHWVLPLQEGTLNDGKAKIFIDTEGHKEGNPRDLICQPLWGTARQNLVNMFAILFQEGS